jgi:hypothetical protein
MPPGLQRRNGRYYLRRRIPLDLVKQYGGKAEITYALGTADPKEARLLRARKWVQLDDEFENLRKAPATANLSAMTNPEGLSSCRNGSLNSRICVAVRPRSLSLSERS